MKAYKAFIKPFEVSQRSMKIKFNLIFSLRAGLVWEGLMLHFYTKFVGNLPVCYQFTKLYRIFIRKNGFCAAPIIQKAIETNVISKH